MSVVAITNARLPSTVAHPYPFLTLRRYIVLQSRDRKDCDRIPLNHGGKR